MITIIMESQYINRVHLVHLVNKSVKVQYSKIINIYTYYIPYLYIK